MAGGSNSSSLTIGEGCRGGAEGPQAAFYRTIGRLTEENEKLTAENMRLKNLVEDSDKVKELVDLQSKFDIAERARKSLQARVDAFEKAKADAKKAAKENKAAAIDETSHAGNSNIGSGRRRVNHEPIRHPPRIVSSYRGKDHLHLDLRGVR